MPGPGEILIAVSACGVCHTELDEIEGRTPPPAFPVVLGHQVVGGLPPWGKPPRGSRIGDRVGVGWIHSACGTCDACRAGNENLCRGFLRNGPRCQRRLCRVHDRTRKPSPTSFPGLHRWRGGAAPLRRGDRLPVAPPGRSQGRAVPRPHRFRRLGTSRSQDGPAPFPPDAGSSSSPGASGSGPSPWSWGPSGPGRQRRAPPEKLHAIIDTTPAWKPVVEALRHLPRRGAAGRQRHPQGGKRQG